MIIRRVLPQWDVQAVIHILERGLLLAENSRKVMEGFGTPMYPWEIDAATLLDQLKALPSAPKEDGRG